MAAFNQWVLYFLIMLGAYIGPIDTRLNGLTALFRSFAIKGEIPGAPGVQMTNLTGYWLLDLLNNVCALVFWEMGPGPLSAVLLQSILMVSSAVATLFLLMLEAGRTESLLRLTVKYVFVWRILLSQCLIWVRLFSQLTSSRVFLFALIGHWMTVAFIIPLLCVWDLRSHTELSSRRDSRPENLTIVSNLKTCVLGLYFAFSGVVFLPMPSVVSVTSKHLLLVLYQSWAFAVNAALVLACYLQKDQTAAAARQHVPSAITSKLRSNYYFAFACASIPYWGVILTSLATTLLPFSALSGYKGEVTLGRIFFPQPLWSLAEVTSILDGTERVLPWDFLIAGAAVLEWAIIRYARACEEEKFPVNYSKLRLQALGLSIAVGPVGTAAILFWKRNEIVEKALEKEKGK